MYVVIAYDIQDAHQRYCISQALLDAGLTRVQKSVFEGAISARQFQSLQKRLNKLIDRLDSIRYYLICDNCRSKTIVQGVNQTPSEDKSTKIL